MVLPTDSAALGDQTFWRDLAPDLPIGGTPASPDIELPTTLADLNFPAIGENLHGDGFFHIPDVLPLSVLSPIQAAIQALRDNGIPPVFIYVYDAPWTVFHALSPLITYFLGKDYALLPNLWAWNIPLQPGARGWPPHRDCQAPTRFGESGDGLDDVIMSLSLWLPITDATLNNGCMCVLPRGLSDHVPADAPLPEDLLAQGINLPATAGSVLGWTQDLYHWSNPVTEQVTRHRETSRMSLSLEFQNTVFDALSEPLLDSGKPPPFDERLRLIARQIPKYAHMETVALDVSNLPHVLT